MTIDVKRLRELASSVDRTSQTGRDIGGCYAGELARAIGPLLDVYEAALAFLDFGPGDAARQSAHRRMTEAVDAAYGDGPTLAPQLVAVFRQAIEGQS